MELTLDDNDERELLLAALLLEREEEERRLELKAVWPLFSMTAWRIHVRYC